MISLVYWFNCLIFTSYSAKNISIKLSLNWIDWLNNLVISNTKFGLVSIDCWHHFILNPELMQWICKSEILGIKIYSMVQTRIIIINPTTDYFLSRVGVPEMVTVRCWMFPGFRMQPPEPRPYMSIKLPTLPKIVRDMAYTRKPALGLVRVGYCALHVFNFELFVMQFRIYSGEFLKRKRNGIAVSFDATKLWTGRGCVCRGRCCIIAGIPSLVLVIDFHSTIVVFS